MVAGCLWPPNSRVVPVFVESVIASLQGNLSGIATLMRIGIDWNVGKGKKPKWRTVVQPTARIRGRGSAEPS